MVNRAHGHHRESTSRPSHKALGKRPMHALPSPNSAPTHPPRPTTRTKKKSASSIAARSSTDAAYRHVHDNDRHDHDWIEESANASAMGNGGVNGVGATLRRVQPARARRRVGAGSLFGMTDVDKRVLEALRRKGAVFSIYSLLGWLSADFMFMSWFPSERLCVTNLPCTMRCEHMHRGDRTPHPGLHFFYSHHRLLLHAQLSLTALITIAIPSPFAFQHYPHHPNEQNTTTRSTQARPQQLRERPVFRAAGGDRGDSEAAAGAGTGVL
jgi:hypothetical protein